MRPPISRKPALFVTAEAVEQAFYDAMQRGDLPGILALWSEDEDSVCVHPGQPRIVGYPAISQSWREIFATQGRVAVRPTEMRVVKTPTLSIHSVMEEVMDEANETVVRCSAVNVYAKEGQGWLMLMHCSAPSGLDEQLSSAYGASLH